MTDQQLIIAVAKLDGCNVIHSNSQGTNLKLPDGDIITIWADGSIDGIPKLNYLTSRDAIIPVIEKQFKNNWAIGNSLIDELFRLHSCPEGSADLTDIYNTSAQITTALLLSTPKQLSIALVKATGKWEEQIMDNFDKALLYIIAALVGIAIGLLI